jgi:hypothetical protein
MATTSLEITWFCFLLTDLQVSHPHVVVLHYDNKVALHIASNLVFHERTKHIELDCHLNPNKIQEGILKTTHISTKSSVCILVVLSHVQDGHSQLLCSLL